MAALSPAVRGDSTAMSPRSRSVFLYTLVFATTLYLVYLGAGVAGESSIFGIEETNFAKPTKAVNDDGDVIIEESPVSAMPEQTDHLGSLAVPTSTSQPTQPSDAVEAPDASNEAANVGEDTVPDPKEQPQEEEDEEEQAVESNSGSNDAGEQGGLSLDTQPRVSKLHFLIPASKPNLNFCYNLASSTANRYPVPTVLGYNGTGEFDAAVTHLAKIRTIDRYLQSLDAADDDDLVLIIDGYDVLLQLPPEVMIERYFHVAHKANARLAARYGLTVEEAQERGLRQTIFWGADKVCWPINFVRARCWAVPEAGFPPMAFGPNTGNGNLKYNEPRWLNSGTAIGPVSDMRKLITATMKEIQVTYDELYRFRESDQYYVSNIYGRQEYFRPVKAVGHAPPTGGPEDRMLPPAQYANEETEYHISLDYESEMFQTKAMYEDFYGYLLFNSSGLTATMDSDYAQKGDMFTPSEIDMPANVYTALAKLYDSVPEKHHGAAVGDWVRNIKLGTNFITQYIYPLWHCTGAKAVDEEYVKMWFYPLARSLIKATVKAFGNGELLSDRLIDGRRWAPKMTYPDANDELGGMWTDYDGSTFVSWNTACGQYEDSLFAGEGP